jgi:tetratricopeptide (TPR) repeat protein
MKQSIYVFLLFPLYSVAQPNCYFYLHIGDTLQYKACIEAEKANEYYQFQKEFYEIIDNSIRICPYFAYAYSAKSTAYLKSGDFLNWKKLIDKAVFYDPEIYLGRRAWCRFHFFRDYRGAIQDIEKLDSLLNYDIGFSINGDYHLNITKAMCYSAINQKQKAIEIFKKQLNTKDYSAGLYDYYQLGVTYYEIEDFENALKAFDKQSKNYELADNVYYKYKIHKILNNKVEYEKYKEIALKLFSENKRMFDTYVHHFNSVYFEIIDE